jgi:hypothetical protein
MLARAREKAIYGEDMGPLERWYTENFTYDLERKFYHERPYPVTGAAFEDIPLLGPILAATIGRVVKPPRLMHVEEWARSGSEGEEYLGMPLRYGERPPMEELGELGPGAPISPFGPEGVIGEQAYRMTEMVGLPGFIASSIKEAVTGTPEIFDQEMQLESARRMYGRERAYWDLELGGGLGSTELFRRLYPHRRRQIPLYNPIRNLMPEWLPGPGEKSPDFLHGDPFVKVAEGELRLPGVGYAAVHPELEGVAPEDYPLIWRMKILGDVAPYSEKFTEHLKRTRAAIKRGALTANEIEIYKTTLEQVQAKKVRKEFDPYKYRDRRWTHAREVLVAANEAEKTEEETSWFERTIGSYWETLAHGAETPFEYLTPVSPASKLVHMRTAVEDYERTQVYGTENAFWSHPIRDFLRPFSESLAESMGFEGIPEHIQDRRSLEGYFDILKYVKFTRLKRTAQVAGDTKASQEFESKRRETLFGLNPYSYNYRHIYRALPRRERDYFKEFVKADLDERERIFELIPENERALYLAKWKTEDIGDLKSAIKKGLLTEDKVEAAEAQITQFYEEARTEGFPMTEDLWEEYIRTRLKGETYPDWYRRTKLLAAELEGRPIPGPDWVGYTPHVELDDIKLKIVEQAGESIYDYDLWPDRQRMAARRPYLAEAAESIGPERTPMTPTQIHARVVDVLTSHNIEDYHVTVTPITGRQTHNIDLRLTENRSAEVRELVRRGALN